jgi:tRNA-specific 2-thiouridylase
MNLVGDGLHNFIDGMIIAASYLASVPVGIATTAAVMLHEQGYEVIGITMKTWDYSSSGGSKKETGCCSLDSINDAREVAVHYGFPHYILDIRNEFGDAIIGNFVNEYVAGRTPNPCVLCNTHIKWSALWKRAESLKCDYIATGHYAKIRKENNRFVVSKGKDQTKDQSYVLWGISQENLAKTIFPLADYVKADIKKMAADYGFHSLVNKSESYDICFIHPKAEPGGLGGEGVLIELVQAPPDVISFFTKGGS